MASSPLSLKLPPDLAETAKLRAKQLKYPSVNAYLKGLIRYDALVQGEHTITLPIAALPFTEQDAMDAKLLQNTKNGVGERGQFLTKLLGKLKEKGKDGESKNGGTASV
jgi:hypothetical protein